MGARYARQFKDLLFKTDFLHALERIANGSNVEQLKQIGEALKQGDSFNQLLEGLSQGQHGVQKSEMRHVARDWFGAKTGWWKLWAPEQQMREGLLRSIALRIEHAKGDTPLPVSYYWQPNSNRFAFVPLLSEHQLTVILMTPRQPGVAVAAPVPPLARRKGGKKKAAKKSASKTRSSN